jgi:hypothetical protein
VAGGASARIRVLACDGVNTGMAVSEPFTVDGKPPLVWITAPISSTGGSLRFEQGTLLVLEGNGTDFEDGPLPDAAFTWRSDRSGPLGEGSRVDVKLLLVGEHTITLEGRDSAGQIGTDTMTIEITERPNAQPVADAGPDLVASRCAARLDGAGSHDQDDEPLLFRWSVAGQPPESAAWFSDPEAPRPLFFADRAGAYAIELVVFDGRLSSFPDRVAVNVTGAGANRLCSYLPLLLRR